ncbi:unnamed protein product [Hymenolepis diminuta]|uniref:Apple domain-containing protein n=1 Tax=Hymenolepis diminuta TaxID=6216 RepID=A0A158QBS7_HYMDI|nr:unnamed protein product [Hymenolepis diminuta]
MWAVNSISSFCELLLLNIKNARTFASSVEEGSSSNFATDEEAHYDQPTCFRSSPNTFDTDMFSWFVVDLGSVVSNITEVYIASGPNYDSDNVEVFVATYMRTSAHINRTGSSLIWDSYEECGKATLDEHAEDTCFRMVDPKLSSKAQGDEFRYERHVSLEQCRESCTDTPSCQGLAFTKESRRGRSGDCRLFRGPESITSRDNVDVDQGDLTQPINCGKWCHLEQNECNRGQVFPLIRQAEDAAYLTPGTIIWKLEDAKLQVLNPQMQKIFFSLKFKGRILCEAESCGAIHILLVSKEGEETFCTSINTDLIYLLDRYTIQCQETRSTTNLGSDTVAIKMVPSKADQSAPKLEITEGHARFILTDKRRQISSVSEIPIRPEEFFVFSLHTQGRDSAQSTKIVEIPITPSEPSWNFKKTTPIFEQNVVKQDPDQNVARENPSNTFVNNLKQINPPVSEKTTAKNFQETKPNSKFDRNPKEEQDINSNKGRYSSLSEIWQDGDESFDSENEAENLSSAPSMTSNDPLNLTKLESNPNFEMKNPLRPSEDWPRYQGLYVSGIEKPKRYSEPTENQLATNKFDSVDDSARDFESYFPSETPLNPKRAGYSSMTPNSMQHDAEDSNQGVKSPISRQSPNLTGTSEANHLSPSDVQVAGSLSLVNLIMIIIIVSVIILAVVAGIVWFLCIRGN